MRSPTDDPKDASMTSMTLPSSITPNGTPAVQVSGVRRQFGDRVVLDNLDLQIAPAEIVVLLGASGCGKSTLLRLLAGLDRPDAGQVRVPKRRAIVFQADRLLPWQRVLENVTLGLRGRDADQKAREVLAEVGLQGREKAWPKTLSGGEAQRVALARALVSEPDLVLMDEPFAALDAITRLRMHDLVRKLHSAHEPALLMVTHDVSEAIALADRIVVMRDGQIARQHHVNLNADERKSSPEREALRAELLLDLGIAQN
jgi:sulfonate transport system ATP-binding protein